MIRRALSVLVLLLLASLVPDRLTAQAPGAAFRAGPSEYSATARLAPAPVAETQVISQSPSRNRRTGILLMIVGGAGLVTGIIVDEPIITIAGAAVAGFGLYMYLDSGGKVGLQVPLP